MDISDPIEHLKGLEDPSKRSMRALVLHLLYALDAVDYQESLHAVIDNFNKGFDLSIDPQGTAAVIVQSIIDSQNELDKTIEPYLENWRQDRISVIVLLIIRFAVWELEQGQTEPRVIINEAIELAKQFAEPDAYRLVNGILDRIVKNQKR
jgi:N utilization substance protein B